MQGNLVRISWIHLKNLNLQHFHVILLSWFELSLTSLLRNTFCLREYPGKFSILSCGTKISQGLCSILVYANCSNFAFSDNAIDSVRAVLSGNTFKLVLDKKLNLILYLCIAMLIFLNLIILELKSQYFQN